jgi:hypothetical protein
MLLNLSLVAGSSGSRIITKVTDLFILGIKRFADF